MLFEKLWCRVVGRVKTKLATVNQRETGKLTGPLNLFKTDN